MAVDEVSSARELRWMEVRRRRGGSDYKEEKAGNRHLRCAAAGAVREQICRRHAEELSPHGVAQA